MDQVFRALEHPVDHYRAVIVGQDPYPTTGYANGLAFSVNSEIEKLPASLRNIFKEYSSDTGYLTPKNGDLTQWADAGVALINSALTFTRDDTQRVITREWQTITSSILQKLAANKSVAILWGSHAQKIGTIFPINQKIESVHPSPLSAYRGFFGSKPFTKTNELLRKLNLEEIDWQLK